MALQKQSITINFSMGVDTLTDPYQLPIGKFESLENSVFIKSQGAGSLNKRFGFNELTTIPQGSALLTTFNDNLIGVGDGIKSYSAGSNQWVNKGSYTHLNIATLPLIRSATNQNYVDIAVSNNGLVACVYGDVSSGSVTTFKFSVLDSITGETVLYPSTFSPINGVNLLPPKVFALGDFFLMLFDGTLVTSSASYTSEIDYQYININNPLVVSSTGLYTSNYLPTLTTKQNAFDGVVLNNTLFTSHNSSGGQGVRDQTISSSLSIGAAVIVSPVPASLLSVAADATGSQSIWTAFFTVSSGSSNNVSSAYFVATTTSFSSIIATQSFVGNTSVTGSSTNIVSNIRGGIYNIFYEVPNAYGFNVTVPNNGINQVSYSRALNSLSALFQVSGGLGIASRIQAINSISYMLAAYQSTYQSTYFLMNAGSQMGFLTNFVPPTSPPVIGLNFRMMPAVAKLAYGNGGGYAFQGVSSLQRVGSSLYTGYLIKDLITPVNKNTNVSSTTQTSGIYTQNGVNMASFAFSNDGLVAAETGQTLNMNGGYLWSYDGSSPTEQNFHLFPEPIGLTNILSSQGNMTPQSYFYQATYEWTDAKGNIIRSSPSIPVNMNFIVPPGGIEVSVPTIRITGKIQNPPKVSIYRWSTAQQVYYQVTSIQVPALNSTAQQFIKFTDLSSDAQILGNEILYTNGGVVENSGGPAASGMTLFDTRLWMISSEDPNLLLFSKQIIENTPVEMSQLFTLFVPPSTSARSSTGPMKCLAPMDDKLILFKANAIFYINGVGPDNTGAQNGYSQSIFITAGVGCSNQNSIVLIPQGLIFQSDKGWWQLGRDLSLQFIGKEVEDFNTCQTLSALTVPQTNEARFTLGSSGQTLVYDYFAGQWDSFSNIDGISSTIYKNKHTYLSISGSVSQETAGSYVDNGQPTTVSFTTGWINLAGAQGYVRAYKMYLLGKFYSPHTYSVGIAYDYNPAIVQTAIINPTNTVGSGSIVEQWQINFDQQQCQGFQLTFQETASSTAGAGLSLSGIKIVVGIKHDFPRNIGVSNKTS